MSLIHLVSLEQSGTVGGRQLLLCATIIQSCYQLESNPLSLQYIACTYDNEWYIGIIMGHSEEQNNVYVRFMTRAKNSNALSWSEDTRNECWVPFQDNICVVSAPEMQGHGGRQYRLTNKDVKNIQGKQPAFIKQTYSTSMSEHTIFGSYVSVIDC